MAMETEEPDCDNFKNGDDEPPPRPQHLLLPDLSEPGYCNRVCTQALAKLESVYLHGDTHNRIATDSLTGNLNFIID